MPAGYYRGFLMEAATNGNTMAFHIRDADSHALHEFTGPAGANNINHAIQSQIEYTFTTPFVAHLCRYEPGNDSNNSPVDWQFYGIQWVFDPWPELSTQKTAWIDAGTSSAKFCTGLSLPLDTANNSVSLNFSFVEYGAAGGGIATGPFNTVLGTVKPVVPINFGAAGIVFHEIQIQPDANCRMWEKEAVWHFEVWPELSQESTLWLNLGTPGAKYLRGIVIAVETGGHPVTLTLVSSDGSSIVMGTVTTLPQVKTPTPFAFTVPLIGHEFRIVPDGPCRLWVSEARWDFDLWPELITEATGWLPVLPGNAAAFLQGLLIPVEADGAAIQLSLLTDANLPAIPLIPTRLPFANVKTPIPYALAIPVVCHQAQIIPTAPCRLWLNEIQWIAEATPEMGRTWTTQATSHGMTGYFSLLRMEAAYTSFADVTLIIAAFDGTSPATITLPSTSGVKQKLLLTPTFNKGQLYTYSAVSSAAFQIFGNEWICWIGQWGRKGSARAYNLLGGAFDDKARI